MSRSGDLLQGTLELLVLKSHIIERAAGAGVSLVVGWVLGWEGGAA